MTPQTFVRITCASAFLAAFVTTGSAQPLDKRTFFEFNSPVAVPGATLAPGKYLFRLNDENRKEIVQILKSDGKTPVAHFQAIRDQRATIPDKPEVRFLETAVGMPAAIKTWYYPGDRSGYEFIYPKKQARLLAEGTGQPVLTTVAETATIAEAIVEQPVTRIAPEVVAVEPTPEATLVGEVAPEPVAETEERTALSTSASNTPLIAFAGLLLLLGAGLVGTARWARDRN